MAVAANTGILPLDTAPPLRCLWIGRYVPYPINEGAKLYSAKLVESLAAASCYVRGLGFGDSNHAPPNEHFEWRAVPGTRARDFTGLIDKLPLAAAVDRTPAYRELLEQQLRERWDVIVLDSYATGWALTRCAQYRFAHGGAPILVHVSHNEEGALWNSLATHLPATSVRKWLVQLNARKVAQLERRLVSSVDLLSTITSEDAEALRRLGNVARVVVTTPGYDGPIAAERRITAATPRRVVIVGSFSWIVKRENLRRFIEHADARFAEHGIQLVVAGDVPPQLQYELSAHTRATRFAGFVPDLSPLLAESRIALVPEFIGGGFKLKFLDYLFGRIPVATVDAAAAGLPPEIREQLIGGRDIEELTSNVLDRIDAIDDLNTRHMRAFAHARLAFSWADRGRALLERILALREDRSSARHVGS
jgi:hypothetical protein